MFRLSVFVFSYVADNVCHNTTMFPVPVCTLSVLQGDSCYNSLHYPLGCDKFLKLDVAKQLDLTAICHSFEYTFVECFRLQS